MIKNISTLFISQYISIKLDVLYYTNKIDVSMSKNNYYKYYSTVTILLVFFLALSSFFANIEAISITPIVDKIIDFLQLINFYSSSIHVLLWLGFAAILVFIVFIDDYRTTTKGLHIMIAVLLIGIILEKSINSSYTIHLKERKTTQLSQKYTDIQDNLSLKLINFNLKQSKNKNVSQNFVSKLILNEQDTILVSVNNPYKYKSYRFYQKSYRLYPDINIKIADTVFKTLAPDTLEYKNQKYIVEPVDQNYQYFSIQSGQEEIELQIGQEQEINSEKIQIQLRQIIKESIIQIKEVKGIRFLFGLFILYLISLAYIFWGQKK